MTEVALGLGIFRAKSIVGGAAMKAIVIVALLSVVLSTHMSSWAACPSSPENGGAPYSPEQIKTWHSDAAWPACCCLDNEVVGENSTPPQGPFDGCPCPHLPGTDPCTYTTREVSLVFEV